MDRCWWTAPAPPAIGAPRCRTRAVDLVRVLGELASRYRRDARREGCASSSSAERAAGRGARGPGGPAARVPQRARQRGPVHAGRAARCASGCGRTASHAHVDGQRHRRGDDRGGARARLRHWPTAGAGAQALRAGGRGLGLTLSRELVEAMGGSISLWSEEDRGSEVPRAPAAWPTETRRVSAAAGPRGRTTTRRARRRLQRARRRGLRRGLVRGRRGGAAAVPWPTRRRWSSWT